MDKIEIIKNISARTGGEVYLGVVGAVRTGKSTFIKKVVERDNILLKTKTKLTCMNSYKLFYTCFVLSMKFNEDRHNSNKFYAKVCGVNINDFLLMEYRALKYLDFSLFIQTETYELYYNNIYSV